MCVAHTYIKTIPQLIHTYTDIPTQLIDVGHSKDELAWEVTHIDLLPQANCTRQHVNIKPTGSATTSPITSAPTPQIKREGETQTMVLQPFKKRGTSTTTDEPDQPVASTKTGGKSGKGKSASKTMEYVRMSTLSLIPT